MAPMVGQVLELCAQRFQKAPHELDPNADVFESLGVDSMQLMNLLTELEQHFNIEIPDYELREVRTFSDLAKCIEQRV